MKTTFTLLFATFFASSAFAYNEGKLTVTVAANNIQVVINGRDYTATENTIVLNNVRSGNHSIKIYKARKNSNRRNNNTELLYAATIQVKPLYHVDVMVNRFGKALIDERSIRDSRWEDDDNEYNNNGYGDNNNDYNKYDERYKRPMSDVEFKQMLQHIKSQWFSGKLTAAREGLSRNNVTTLQVKEVLQLFSTDSDKLELAKLAYRNVTDDRNFYLVYDVFYFQNTKDELAKYTLEQR